MPIDNSDSDDDLRGFPPVTDGLPENADLAQMQAAYHRAVGKAYHEHKRSLRVFSGELELPEGEPDPDFFMERAFAKARLIYDRYVALSGGQPPQERDDIPEF